MRFCFALTALLATAKVGESFVPGNRVGQWGKQVSVFSTVEAETEASAVETPEVPAASEAVSSASAISGAEIKAKLEAQLAKLREKDSKSPSLSKEVSELQLEHDGRCSC